MRYSIQLLFISVAILLSYTSFGQTTVRPVLPADAAPYTVNIYDTTNTGYYFMGSYRFSSITPYPSSLMIIDGDGYPVFFKSYPLNDGTWADLRVYPNGLMSYYHYIEAENAGKYYIMDSTFTVIDSVVCGNGLQTDGHEMLMMDNGHYYIICLEDRVMDLSSILTDDGFIGSPTGAVKGPVVQELDENKNVIFEWRGLDHYSLNDIDNYFFLDPQFMDFGHPNAIAINDDGDILLSLRFFNEVTKISRADSSIIWRLGGKQNQFTFVGDTAPFSAQHNIEILPNGNITLYDNGERSNPPTARGIEYELDENSMTATRVWDFKNDPSIVSYALGSMQRTENGNSVISWGAAYDPGYDNDFMELTEQHDTVLTFDQPQGYFIYRTYKETPPWQMETVRPKIVCDTSSGVAQLYADTSLSNIIWNTLNTSYSITIDSVGTYYYYTQNPNGYFFAKPWVVTDLSNACNFVADTVTDTIIDTIISINDPTVIEYNIYPNPSNNKVTLVGSKPYSLHGSIHVVNAIGQNVYSDSVRQLNTYTFDVSLLPSGVYLVNFITEVGVMVQFKLLVEH